MIFNHQFEDPWGAETRLNKLVFIGKNLDKEELTRLFDACMSTPESRAKKVSNLRFQIGDKVECSTEKGWSKGTVVAHMYREPGMPPGMTVPYQIKLDRGPLIFAPADDDRLIRKA